VTDQLTTIENAIQDLKIARIFVADHERDHKPCEPGCAKLVRLNQVVEESQQCLERACDAMVQKLGLDS
jgi:hypothetical protein